MIEGQGGGYPFLLSVLRDSVLNSLFFVRLIAAKPQIVLLARPQQAVRLDYGVELITLLSWGDFYYVSRRRRAHLAIASVSALRC